MYNKLALPLESKNLSIRCLEQTDWGLFCRLYTNSKVMQHIGKPWELEPLKQKFEQRIVEWHRDTFEWLTLVIELNTPPQANSPMRKDHASIGIFGLRCINYESRIAEVYLLIEEKYQNQGYAVESLKSLLPYIFYNLNYHKVVASCTKHNIPAQQTLKTCDFHQEGILRHNSFIDDQFIDDFYYGLLLDEFHK